MAKAFICDLTCSPVGRYVRALRDVRTDQRAAHPTRALVAHNIGTTGKRWTIAPRAARTRSPRKA